MTDRLHVLTVALQPDLRDDDAQPIIDAIKQLRGVVGVTPHVVDHNQWSARQQTRHELGSSIYAVFRAVLDGRKITIEGED